MYTVYSLGECDREAGHIPQPSFRLLKMSLIESELLLPEELQE
jgi:hypothetical protein